MRSSKRPIHQTPHTWNQCWINWLAHTCKVVEGHIYDPHRAAVGWISQFFLAISASCGGKGGGKGNPKHHSQVSPTLIKWVLLARINQAYKWQYIFFFSELFEHLCQTMSQRTIYTWLIYFATLLTIFICLLLARTLHCCLSIRMLRRNTVCTSIKSTNRECQTI